MKSAYVFSLLAAVTLFSAPAAEATPDISVSLSGPAAGTGDTIYCGQTVTFNIHLSNTTGTIKRIHGSVSDGAARWREVVFVEETPRTRPLHSQSSEEARRNL